MMQCNHKPEKVLSLTPSHLKLEKLAICDGIVPVRSGLRSNDRVCKFVSCQSSVGTEPLCSLLYSTRPLKLLNRPISEGILPPFCCPYNSSPSKEVMCPICVETVPWRRLNPRDNVVSDVSKYNSSGKDPARLF